MTTPSPSAQPTQPARPFPRFFDAIRRTGIVRTSDRWLGGVAAGIAHKLGISVGAMRLILVLAVVVLGLSIWFYIAAWVLLPDERTGRIALETLLTPR